MPGTNRGPHLAEHRPDNAMDDPDEISRFHDRCSDLMRELLNELAASVDQPRAFPDVEHALGWPRRRIASVLGGVWHLRTVEFAGRRPYRFLDERLAIRTVGDLVRRHPGRRDPRCGRTGLAGSGVLSSHLVRQGHEFPAVRRRRSEWRRARLGATVVCRSIHDPGHGQQADAHVMSSRIWGWRQLTCGWPHRSPSSSCDGQNAESVCCCFTRRTFDAEAALD